MAADQAKYPAGQAKRTAGDTTIKAKVFREKDAKAKAQPPKKGK